MCPPGRIRKYKVERHEQGHAIHEGIEVPNLKLTHDVERYSEKELKHIMHLAADMRANGTHDN